MKKSRTNLYLTIIITPLLLLTACGSNDPAETKETAQEPPAKKIEIFTVGQDQTPLSFTKNGQLESGTSAYVMPQIAGKITNISVNVGDKVNKGQNLITLGNSLSTDSAQLNQKLAQESLQKLYDTKFKTDYSAQKDIDATLVGYYAALDGLSNAIKAKDHANALYDEQHDLLEDTVDDLEDTLDDLKDPPDYKNNPNYKELKTAYDQAESQLSQLEIGHEAQEDQLDLAIQMAKAQLEGAILTVEGVQAKYSLQFIQLDSTILQAETGADLAALQAEARNIRSPIEGTVTNIQAEEGNFANPGQILLTVENIQELEVKTFLSPEEIPLINDGDLVSISTSTSSTTGKVNYISPTLKTGGKAEIGITLSDKKNLYSGEIVEITFTPDLGAVATLIPLNSVIIEDEKYYINTVGQDKTITRKQITIGQIIGDYIEVLNGLNFGEKIALSTVFLREGDKVIYKVKRSAKTPKS